MQKSDKPKKQEVYFRLLAEGINRFANLILSYSLHHQATPTFRGIPVMILHY
jgi:hypothetical protein